MAYQDKNLNYIDAEAYDKRGESSVLENYVLELWQPFLKEKIKKLSAGKTVVDWGCGTCEYASAAAEAAAEKIYAVDDSEPMLKVCREKLAGFENKEIILGSGFHNGIPAGAADLVLTIGVWEYAEPRPLVGEIKRLTEKGAKIVVVFPNIYNKLNTERSIWRKKRIALRPGFIKNIFKNDFTLVESASFGMVSWCPKKFQSLILPLWKLGDFIWKPFQKFMPLGINVYYLFERK